MRSGRITLPLAPTGGIDRRGFCQLVGACVAGLAIGGCTDDGNVIQTGPLQDGPDDGGPDAPPGHPDAAMPDASAGTCTGTQTDVGAPTSFATGTATLFTNSRIYIVRDAGGLFAVSSRCTHRTTETIGVTSGHFRCPRHGAQFTFTGTVTVGPAILPLAHYALCLLGNGHVGVDTTTTVPAGTRLDA